MKSSFFKKFILPGLVFQGILIGGGYGTGREIIEYFMKHGPLGGILGMFFITLAVWTIMAAATFELSRKFKLYDYRSFFKKLLGRFWFTFEIMYILLLLIVLAVISSAVGVLLRDFLAIPYIAGVIIMLISVGFLTFKGSNLIEYFLSAWSIIIYVVYGLFLIISIVKFGPLIQENFSSAVILPGWALGGFKYSLYNLCAIPPVLFCIKHIETRKEAFSAGFLAALIGILPGFLFYVTLLSQYPEVILKELPAVYVIQIIRIPFLLIIYIIMLIGTLIQTGTGFIHSVNERIQSSLQERGKNLSSWQRSIIAAVMFLASLGLSTFGLINLIAKGYGMISWIIFIIYLFPLITMGLHKIFKD